jgi:glucosylceramidase
MLPPCFRSFAVSVMALFVVGLSAVQAADSAEPSVAVYATVKGSPRKLARLKDTAFSALPQPSEQEQSVFVDPAKRFQTVLGIGGALTDAAAETFYKLPKDKQREVIQAYFDPRNGIGYSLGRTHIHSCDFSSRSYTYVRDGDRSLDSFDISEDLKYRIPFIKEAMAAAGKEFTMFVSPWSPPAWMKSNHSMLHGGSLTADCGEAWASYYVKFIRAYEKAGIPIWGLTVQNEPMASQTWESCIYTAEEERDFLKNHLGPTLQKAGLGDRKIVVWDHNRSMMYQRAKVVLDDPQAAQYAWGVGYHWYVGDHFDNVSQVQSAYPETHLLFTEGCNGPYDASKLDEWQWGELYGKSMVHDFNGGAVGWTDWNVLLDETGGPNHARNFCFAPIHGDTRTGALHYMNSFYYIGHFSKFIRPGARRIISSTTADEIESTAFLNPDGDVVVVVLNTSEKGMPLCLWVNSKAARFDSRPHSIMTLVFSPPKGQLALDAKPRTGSGAF